MKMHSVANLATLQTPLATFIPFKKAPKPYLVSDNRRYAAWAPGLAFPARAHTSLSLSLSVRLLCSARSGEEQRFQLNTDIMLLL